MPNAGTVVWFNERKGFGFIRDDVSGQEVFVRFDVIERDGFLSLSAGEHVEFEYAPESGGPKAARVTVSG